MPIIPVEEAFAKVDKKKLLKLDNKEALEKLVNLKPTSFQAILKCTGVKNLNDLGNLEQRPELQGMVINEIESLGSKEREHLKQNYPNTDFEKCLVIEPARQPAGMGKLAGLLGGGALGC